jgi:hypothetical protein
LIIFKQTKGRLLNIKRSLSLSDGECGVRERIDFLPGTGRAKIIASKCLLCVFVSQDHLVFLHVVDFGVLGDALLVVAVILLYCLRQERGYQFFLLELLPLHPFEEGVAFDLLDAICAQPALGATLDESVDKIHAFLAPSIGRDLV